MATVSEFQFGWSIQRLAEALGMDRTTIRSRLQEARVEPCGERMSHPVYDLKPACEAIFGNRGGGAVKDPTLLPPQERRMWYQSENERIKLETSTGMLVPAAEVETDYAEFVKLVAQFFDTLPDVLERDVGLTPEQVISAQSSCDRVRQQMYEMIQKGAGDADACESA